MLHVDPQLDRTPRRASDGPDLGALIGRVARGDQSALAALYDATSPWIHGLVLRIVGETHAAEEATLDAFMQVWRSAASYASDRGTVRAWLATIARSRALDAVRRRRVRREVTFDDVPDTPGDVTPPEHATSQHETKTHVESALSKLPPAQRRTIELAYYGGLSHTEIARRLGQPLGTIKTQIRLGLRKLERLVAPDLLEET